MSYKDQFYKEGLAITFYQKPVKYVKKKIKNRGLANFMSVRIGIIYTLLAIAFAVLMFIVNFPL